MGHYRSEMCCQTCGGIPCKCLCKGCNKSYCVCPCEYCGGTKSEWHNCKERWEAIGKAWKKMKLNSED